jgi:hypothetical protein
MGEEQSPVHLLLIMRHNNRFGKDDFCGPCFEYALYVLVFQLGYIRRCYGSCGTRCRSQNRLRVSIRCCRYTRYGGRIYRYFYSLRLCIFPRRIRIQPILNDMPHHIEFLEF